jgi:hypothetical protein
MRPRDRHVLPVIGTGLILAGAAVGMPTTKAAAQASPPAITFSHGVVVDQQRPGFEPDVKVAPNGAIYSSLPFGFSTTASYVWSSQDNGSTYQLTPGNAPPQGKPITCAGGGDTDLQVDPSGQLYFSDLQGLTNISQSTSADGGATWTSNCAGVPNAPVDRMWFTSTGTLPAANLNLYEDYDAVDSAATLGNELVETVSHDGVTFQPVIRANPPGSDCAGAGLVNCVTDNEGISGNQVVDPVSNNLFISHTDSTSSGVFVSEGKVGPGAVPGTTQATWTESPMLDSSLCPDPTCVDSGGNAEAIAGENFASIARDSAGYLYVAFAFAPVSAGTQTGAEAIYVVHSLQPATGADPSTVTWSKPLDVSQNQATPGTDIFPWVTSGSNGRVAVAWYHTDETSEGGVFGAGSLNNAEWTVQMGESLTAHNKNPSYTTVAVTEHPIKHGQICTNGLGCVSGGDRSLGDFLQVVPDNFGDALVSYVDDTSADTSAGEDAGPTEISRQITGPRLFAHPDHGPQLPGNGPGLPVNAVEDVHGDAFYSAKGSRTPAGANLDLSDASLKDGTSGNLLASITVQSLASLTVSPTVGGPDASWIIRWTDVTPGQTGNGHIYYAGMDNNGGTGTPTFFDGDTSCIPPPNPGEHCKFMTFPQTHVLSSSQASYNPRSGVIKLSIPLADVGNPAAGKTLYSVTAFTATSATPQSATTLFTLTDATPPFEHTIAATTVATAGIPVGALLVGGGLGLYVLEIVRRRRHLTV